MYLIIVVVVIIVVIIVVVYVVVVVVCDVVVVMVVMVVSNSLLTFIFQMFLFSPLLVLVLPSRPVLLVAFCPPSGLLSS